MTGASTMDGESEPAEESPNFLICQKMEDLVTRMQDDNGGVPIRTVKSFMSKIPSVFTGVELVNWIVENLAVMDREEAVNLSCLITSFGYIFSITDYHPLVKDDGSFYRFQTPYFWLSNNLDPENIDYAVYLCKRTMQNKSRLELDDYEAENLAKLQRMFSKKWDFVFMQAEAQAKVDKKREKTERQILDSQERAFWNVHRPPPGCVSVTEVDIKKACKIESPTPTRRIQFKCGGITRTIKASSSGMAEVKREVSGLKEKLHRRRVKVSQAAESLNSWCKLYTEFDAFLVCPEPSNPWITDDVSFWEQEKAVQNVPLRRVRRWGFSLMELLTDPSGRMQFAKFLEKEFSVENIRFWIACEELKDTPNQNVAAKVQEIYDQFVAEHAPSPINVDSRVQEVVMKNVKTPSRYTFDIAQDHIFKLMKSDSYQRFLRSDMYRDLQTQTVKPKSPLIPRAALQNLSRMTSAKAS